MTSEVPLLEDMLVRPPLVSKYIRLPGEDRVAVQAEWHNAAGHGQEHRAPLRDVSPDASAFQSWWKSFIAGNVIPVPDSKPAKVVDLFCASGGLSLGLETAAGWLGESVETVLAADLDEQALEVFSSQHDPRRTFSGSVDELVSFTVRHDRGNAFFAGEPALTHIGNELIDGPVDYVIGGPPCQGNSSLNTHTRHEDPRNRLYLTTAAFAVACGARGLLIENVPGVRRDRNGIVETTRSALRSAGYKVAEGVIAADDLGWPQTRKRFFMLALRDTNPLDISELASAFRQDPQPVSWLLADYLGRDPSHYLDVPSELSAANLERIAYLDESDELNLPDELRPDCHKDGNTYPSIYGRMDWDKPAGTITTGFSTPGRGRFIHPTEARVLTPREAAVIQGFPEDYFEMSHKPTRGDLAKWIGDAVPPILGAVASLGLFVGGRA